MCFVTYSFFFISFAPLLQAQGVHVPRAQQLIDTLLREHSEIQTIGLHVTPPGWTEDVNIACSKPGKVGKRSAAVDMEVEFNRQALLAYGEAWRVRYRCADQG